MSLKDIFNEEEMKIGSKVHQKLQFYIDKYSSLFSIDIEDIGLNAYYMYPCMFKDDFEEISDEEKVELAINAKIRMYRIANIFMYSTK